ncbi:hypothetical protein FIBSPDRAFT_988064 [Athelia psychrophila]|uniref:Uncharacterized protein n=1 Tax=Athelia psychrophila TaxID=1759441 RepID=A0A166A793_9AGAM|nr:hypothetical protein FIBSPDRAFT_988064 [Fibularhizoctonia sp. CBS 109695]
MSRRETTCDSQPKLTDNIIPKRLGPKPSTKTRRFFSLSKQEDARKEVTSVKKADVKPYTKAPEIQTLVTPIRLHRRGHLHSLKKRKIEYQKEQKTEYDVLIAKRVSEKKVMTAAVKASHK